MGLQLFPEFSVPDMAPAQEVSSKNQNVKSFKFDIQAGDFVSLPSGKSVMMDPIDTWILWCNKALATERFNYRAYSVEYGVEFERTSLMELKERQSWIERTISETLLADPLQRTNHVKDFSYQFGPDSAYVQFIVVGQDGMAAVLSVQIGGV